MSKIIQVPTATLSLDTISATSTSSNGCVINYNNVNLMNLFKNGMFEKYDLFNLQLLSLSIGVNTFGTATADRFLKIQMSGLNWQNQNYNPLTNQFLDYVNVAFFNTTTGSGTILYLPNNNIFTFRKKEFANIQLSVLRMSDDLPSSASPFPNMSLNFLIIGVVENIPLSLSIDDKITTESKLKKQIKK